MIQEVTNRPTVLVVDDNPLIVSVVKSLLQSENFLVITAKNGEEAMNCLSQSDVDVIVCDVMMPKMDGYGLHDVVRKKPNLCHIPFLFLTALDTTEEVRKGKEIGADDYLTKPFSPEDLIAVVKGKVSRSRGLRNLSEEKFDSYKKRVIHTLSHEFRTPLVAINTGAEILLEQEGGADSKKVRNLLEAVYRGGQRLERLVTDFLLLQQIEAGIAQKTYDSRKMKRNISDVVSTHIRTVQEELSKNGFKLYHHDECEGVMVLVYEPHILEILRRLTNNATKFHGQDKIVEINVLMRGKEVSVEVLDKGIGIKLDKVKEAIDLFGQIDRDKMEQQGGGLGLAIATRYAGINGGRIDLSNRPGGGACVSLLLPVQS